MRIGIYGGTFSPVHNGHVIMAQSFLKQMELDKLYIIPTCLPPHKAEVDGASAYERMDMCTLAFGGIDRVCVSDIEIKRGDKSYTVDTLRELKGEGELYFLCGSDMFLTLESWREPAEIFKLAHIVLGRRESDELIGIRLKEYKTLLEEKYGARIHEISFPAIEVSSSDIRERVGRLESVNALVPEKVERYIYANGLYRGEDSPGIKEIRRRVRTMMSEKRYLHTLGVERECASLARIFAPEKCERLRAAALLHDITKEYTPEKHAEFCEKYALDVSESMKKNPKLYHAFTGAHLAKALFPESTDEKVFDAITYHTTGRRGMTLCDMLLYLADYIEDTRTFEDCVRLRRYFYDGISKKMTA